MNTLLSIENLNKHFDGVVAVDNLSLSVVQGTITGIFGENGAGKSTLFNLISGFEKPDTGIVLFKGEDITHKSVLFRAQKGMGRLFQAPRIFFDVSVYENLIAAAKNSTGHHFYNYIIKRSIVKKEAMQDAQRANDILKQINLADKAYLKAYELSVGERKLLSLGCLLMNEAQLMLLDEPFAGLNEKMIEQLKNTLLSIKQQGTTLLVIEHNMKAMGSICEYIIEMKQGKII